MSNHVPQPQPAENQSPEVIKNPLEVKADLKDRREIIMDAMSQVRQRFGEVSLNLQADRAKNNEEDIIGMLTESIGKIDLVWIEEIQKAKTEEEIIALSNKYRPLVNEALQIAEGLIADYTETTGWLTPEVIAKMKSDMQKISRNLASIITKKENKDVLNAYKWAINALTKGDKISEAPDTFATLKKRIPEEYPRGDNGLMPILWFILSAMSKTERGQLVKELFTADPALDKAEFLQIGNSRGVFTVSEMEELGNVTYSEEDKAKFTEAWRIQNDHRKQATEMMMKSYGSTNAANEMLTLGNIGLTFVQFVAGTTIVGNIITDVFQGGKPKSFEGIVKAVTKPHNFIAGGAFAAVSIYRQGLTWKEVFESKGSRETAQEKGSYEKLNLVMNGDASWGDWNTFFKAEDGNGMRAFFDYVQQLKALNDGKIDENLKKKLNGTQFSDYLDRMSKNPNAEKKIDYAALKKSFDEIEYTGNILTLGQIFDNLNIGGAISITEYEEKLKKAENFPERA